MRCIPYPPNKKKREAHVLEPAKAGEQTTSSNILQAQRRGSAVAKKKARECSSFSVRCFDCYLGKIRGAIALLMEPTKAVEQTHTSDVLQNQKRESAVLFSSKQASFPNSVAGKFCSKCCSFDGCKHFDFCGISNRKTMFKVLFLRWL